MRIKSLSLVILLVTMASCTVHEPIQPAYKALSINVSSSSQPESKSYMPSGGTIVYWTKTDRLFVFGEKQGDIQQTVFSPEFTSPCKSGVFSTTSWPDGYVPTYASNSNGSIDNPSKLTCTADGIIRAFINPTQKIANVGSYGQSASASVGEVVFDNVNYYIPKMLNVPSLLRVNVEKDNISEIKIETIGEEFIAGYVDIDYAAISSGQAEYWSAVEGEKSIVLKAVGTAASESGCFLTGTTYCACVLPQTYEQGFKITMTDIDGKVGAREVAKPIRMPRDTVRSFAKAIDTGIEFKEVRKVKTLDFSTVGANTFMYDVSGTATKLPQRTAAYIAAGTDFWGSSYPSYKFNGAVRYWTASGGALNSAGGTYVRFPRISGYKLTSVTDFKVVHSSSRNYKITSAAASSYADGIPVKGGEEQSLSSGSSATSFVLKDKYDSLKNYYLVCNSEAGYRFKLVYTPDDQLDPEPTGDAPVTVARWRIKSQDLTTAKLTKWEDSNSFPALSGDYANEAYISTSEGPVRTASANQLAVGNIKSGDAINFTIPVKNLAAGSSVDFMTTLRAGSNRIPKYWIFEYYDDGQWKTVAQDLLTASDDGNVQYSLFMTTESDLFTSFCQNFSIGKAIEGEGVLKMRLRAVGSIACDGGAISASASSCLCFASYSNYYVSCEIAIYRGIDIKDTKKVLFVGNSYTYYNASYFMFKEIARSQGHDLRLRATIKGGEDMSSHVNYPHVTAAVSEGGYDYAFLQESALYVAKYFDGTRDATYTNCKAMVDKVKASNPTAVCSIEDCWSSPTSDQDWRGYGSYDTFQRSLLGGALSIAEQTSSWITPVGISFKRAYHDGFTDLWSTADYTHPSLFGSYIKACTFYFLVYGETLDSNVPDCGINAATAVKLREYARNAVLDNNNRAKCMKPDVDQVDNF